MSFLESIVNILIGYGINLLAQILVFPIFNIHIPLHDNIMIGIIFTFISLARSYVIRRWFNTQKTLSGSLS